MNEETGRSSQWQEWDATLEHGMGLYREDMTAAQLNELRRGIGTLSPFSRFLGDGETRWSRFLWRIFNVEYTW